MKTIILVFASLLCTLTISKAQNYSFDFEGQARNYILHLPTNYSSDNEYPLVLNFHGLESAAIEQQLYTQMNQTADLNNFIVVYPNGIDKAWNTDLGLNIGVNDVGFVNALLDTLIKNYSINQAKIYSCGMSMGGFFTNKLACELSNRIAAFASVTGLLAIGTDLTCNPSRSVPFLLIHGTSDPVVNYNGIDINYGINLYRSAPQTIEHWVEENSCTSTPETTAVENISITDNSTVQLIQYKNCDNNTEVWFYKVDQGGHTWPGGIIDLPDAGNTNRDIVATTEIWNFFNKFSLPLITSVEEKHSATTISLYPNPATEFITLEYSDQIEQLVITDLSGKELYKFSDKINQTIDISHLNKGAYILKIINKNGDIKTSNFIKN